MNYFHFISGKHGNSLRMVLFLFLTVLFCETSVGQSPDPDTTGSIALIKRGIGLNDEGKYEEALACFGQVSKCDPNFTWALYESALSLDANKMQKEALKKCDEAILYHYDIPQLYSLKGSILDDMGKSQEGAAIIESALKTWPYNQNLLFNLAVCLDNMNEPEQAEKILIKSLRIDPYHLGSNLALAKTNLLMGRLGQAYLAYNMAMILSPKISVIAQYENALFGKFDTLIKAYQHPYGVDPDEAKWKELTILLQTGFPYRDDFDFPFNPDYKVMRMSYLLLQSITFDQNDTSLYNQFYVRFFNETMEKYGFNMFMNYCLKNVNNANVQEWLGKNQDQFKKFISWAQDRINTWERDAFSFKNELNGITLYHYDDNGNLVAIGASTGPQENKLGNWITIEKDGSVSDSGAYENGKMTGIWKQYWPNGAVKQRLNFKDDDLDGECLTYYDNGVKSANYHFIQGKKWGKEEHFTPSGNLIRLINFKNDTADGAVMVRNYEEWNTREFSNLNNRTNGLLTEKWFNGARKYSCNYKNGLRDGICRYWGSNDSLEAEESFVNDTLNGFARYYYRNGKIMSEGTYDEKGQLQGVFLAYYRNGKLKSMDSSYVGGKLTGTRTEYFYSGVPKEIVWYKNNERTRIVSYDSTGKIIYESEPENGIFHYKAFYPDGRILQSGDFVKNIRDGEWISYSPAGIKLKSVTFLNDQLTGLQLTWYKNGNPKERYQTDSGKIVGPYIEYYATGNIKVKSNYRKSGAYGDWFTFYPNDSLESRLFMMDDHPAGCEINKSFSNKIITEDYFENDGTQIRTRFFDRIGNLIYDWDYRLGKSKCIVPYPDGSAQQVISICDNLKEGTSELYYPNHKPLQKVPWCFGRVEGTVTSWDPSGNLQDEDPFIMGKRNGLNKYYHYGKLVAVTPWEEDNLEGKETDYYENGRVSTEIAYSDNMREGNSDYYSPEGTFMCRIIYWNDVIAGYTYPGPNGKLLPIKPVTQETIELNAAYPDGKPSLKAGLKSGMYNGKVIYWYPDGDIQKEGNFKDDELDGVFRFYDPGKILRELITYKDGYRFGQYRHYYPNGKVHLQGKYLYDKEDGEWQLFDENGNMKASYMYDGGNLYEIKNY